MEIRKIIWFIYMQLSPFSISTLLLLSNICSKTACWVWKTRINKVLRKPEFETGTNTAQVQNAQYFLESYNLGIFFLATVTGADWELCLKNIPNSLYHASMEKGIVLAQLIKSIYLFDNLQLLAICRCRWITSLIVSVSIPKDPWYGIRKNIFPKRYY